MGWLLFSVLAGSRLFALAASVLVLVELWVVLGSVWGLVFPALALAEGTWRAGSLWLGLRGALGPADSGGRSGGGGPGWGVRGRSRGKGALVVLQQAGISPMRALAVIHPGFRAGSKDWSKYGIHGFGDRAGGDVSALFG